MNDGRGYSGEMRVFTRQLSRNAALMMLFSGGEETGKKAKKKKKKKREKEGTESGIECLEIPR